MRLFRHALQILILGSILFLMLKIHLFDIPYIKEILAILVFLLLFLCIGLLFYRASKRKRKFWLIFLFVTLFSLPSYAANFCSWAENYDRQRFTSENNNWKDDQPCTESQWKQARVTLNKLKISPKNFVPTDELTAKQQQTYRSFRQDSHWSKWVSDNFSAMGTSSAEELACAAQLASLCSGYEARHPGRRRRFTVSGSRMVSGSGAKTVTQILTEDQQEYGFWPCRMARIIMTTVQEMSSTLESDMCSAGLDFLKIFMLLWILYLSLIALVFPSKGATFIKDFMTRFLCVLIAATILSSENNLQSLYKGVLSPIVSLGLGLSQEISDATDQFSFSFANSVNPSSIASEDDYCNAANAGSISVFFPALGNYTFGQSDDTFLSRELQLNLLCLTQKLYRQVSPITAAGQSLMSFAKADGYTLGSFVFPDPLSMWFIGLVLTVLFTIFSFLVAFKIIDIFLRLGFVLVLMPLFVATWAFPLTRDFTKKGFMFLMSIITEFLGLVIALHFIMSIFEAGIATNRADLIRVMTAPYSKKYGENLYNVITSDNGWYFLFMLVAIYFMGIKVISMCTKIISSFFGTGAVGGDVMGAVAMSAIQVSGKLFNKGRGVADKAKAYKVPNGKSLSHLAGRAYGRIKSGQNPLKDLGESNSPAASKRYFGQKAGNGTKRLSQYLAAGIDKVGVGLGQGLSKTGIGAVVGVPLTLATKTLSVGVRAAGRLASGIMKAPGATVRGIKNLPQNAKNLGAAVKNGVKNAPKAIWNKVTAGPKKIRDAFKSGMKDGDKK